MDWRGPPPDRVDWDAVLRDLTASPRVREPPRALPLEVLETVDWDAAASAALGITDPVGQIANIIWSWIDSIKKSLGEMLSAAIGPVRDAVASIVSGVVNAVLGGAGTIGDAISSAWSFVKDSLTRVGKWIEEATKVLQGIGAAFAGFSNAILQLPQLLWQALPDWLKDLLAGLADFLTRTVPELFGRVIPEFFGRTLPQAFGAMADFFARMLPDAFRSIGDFFVKTLPAALSDFVSRVAGALSPVADFFARVLPGAFAPVVDFFTKVLPDFFTRVLPDVFTRVIPGFFADLGQKLAGAFGAVVDFFTKVVPDALWKLVDAVKGAFGTVARFFTEILPGALSGFVSAVAGFFTQALPRVFTVDLPNFLRELAEKLGAAVGALAGVPAAVLQVVETARQGLETALKAIAQVPQTIVDTVARALMLPPELQRRLGEWLQRCSRDPLGCVIELASRLAGRAAETLRQLLDMAWKHIVDALKWVWGKIMDGAGALAAAFLNAVGDFWRAVSRALLDVALAVFKWAAGVAADVVRGVKEILGIKNPAGDPDGQEDVLRVTPWWRDKPWTWMWEGRGPEVEFVFLDGLLRTRGMAHQMWAIGGELLGIYWLGTLVPLVLRGLSKLLEGFTLRFEFAPELHFPWGIFQIFGVASKWQKEIRINAAELLHAIGEGFGSFAHAFAIGTSFAVAQLFLANLQHLYVPRIMLFYERYADKIIGETAKEHGIQSAIYSFMVRVPLAGELVEWARRWIAAVKARQYAEEIKEVGVPLPPQLAPRDMQQVLDTVKLHMIYLGLPRWYVEYAAQDPDRFYIVFEDRFGERRKISLSMLYELPTHSELARMTQRDIFPSVRTMQAVAWIRGWTEDMTTMMYLLTFRYPGFEKLWQFYMRATAGMLWYEAPPLMKSVFESEADQVRAGRPITPYAIQKALEERGADAMRAFETALGLYLKWLEYSNFSWIRETTTVQGVPVGREVCSRLGGWTADSWLMWDVAADIPTKIDMRWMSRYGIFQHMAERIGEEAFSRYAPLVEQVRKVLDAQPASPLTVELHWFSKLLQATGLHPAWVPIVTVAENVMAIADEMTLLRTGWINLFKEGLLTLDAMERALSGLFIVSYKVGYWDPVSKTWGTYWVNLPVRWLPHERRLLEYRALIDRVMDLYREYYGYLRSAVRAMVVTPEEAAALLRAFVGRLNEHYAKVAREITGLDVSLKHDEEYVRLWLDVFAQLGRFEAMERARLWWQRVSGWLLYRVAQGYVDPRRVEEMLQRLRDLLKLTDVEIGAYTVIVRSIFDIVQRERVPTPWQVASLAEYVEMPAELAARSIETYNVPEEFRPLLLRYIAVKPLKADYRAIIGAAVRAWRYGAIGRDALEEVLRRALEYGFTEREVELIRARAELEHLIDEIRQHGRGRPLTPWQLATIAEYVDVPADLISRAVAEYGVPQDYAGLVARYVMLRPVKADYRAVIGAAIRAFRLGALPREQLDAIVAAARDYGFTDREVALLRLRADLEELAAFAREYVPTPAQLAAMAEYVPLVKQYAAQALAARRVAGIWAELWLRYVHARTLADDLRAWARAALALVESLIADGRLLDAVASALRDIGYEDAELALLRQTVVLGAARRAWQELLGRVGELSRMSRYAPAAADLAWRRLETAINALPVDDATKNLIRAMWRQFLVHYQNYPEIRAYANELVSAYAYGVIGDAELDAELQRLRELGVPDVTLALIRRRAQLRRLRVAAGRRR